MSVFLEVTYVLGFLSLWLVPFAMNGLWYWFWFFACVGVVLGVWEIYTTKKTGRSLSGRFYQYRLKNPKKAGWIILCLALGWIMLLLHLYYNVPIIFTK